MKIFLFVFAATVFEAAGDAIVRIALQHQPLSARIGLFLRRDPVHSLPNR
jgi:hypothetical protein